MTERTGRTITRRGLLKTAAVTVAAPYIVPASARGAGGAPAPSERIALGMIGLGSMGLRHVKGFLPEDDCRIIGVCDVDAARRKTSIDLINAHYGSADCAGYNDFEDLIARPDVDALCIAIPDHWHAIPVLLAARAGKDIYGEKPLALTIADGQRMVRAVNRYGIVWQTGSWQRSTRNFRFACELVRNGRIGELKRVEVGLGSKPSCEAQPPQPVPPGFDYERWLGPAPWAPYTEKRCHWNFRWILDYSGGQLTDMGAHEIDIAHWGMGLDGTGPVRVEGTGEFPPEGLWNAAVHYNFTATYANGLTLYADSGRKFRSGIRFIGSDGWVFVSRSALQASPASLLREKIGPNEIRLARPQGDHRQGHRRDFLDCVKSRAATITPIEIGHRSITVAHLANISMLLGRPVRWDPDAERIIGDQAAAGMCSRSPREPWTL